MAKAAGEPRVVIEVPPLHKAIVEITLIGDSPLITHAWSEKAKKEIADKQQKKAKQGRPPKNPQEEYEGAMYKLEDGACGIPCIAFKAAAVSAANDAGIAMTVARRAFHVMGQLVRIDSPNEPTMREDMVRVGMGVADIRYRPEFWPWSVTLTIAYNSAVVSIEQLVNLFQIAGFGVGIGEWRPEKNGQFGLFHVEGMESNA